jgi:hypothetical protein
MYYYLRYTLALLYIRTIYSSHDDDTNTDTMGMVGMVGMVGTMKK